MLHNDPFDVAKESGSTLPSLGLSSKQSILVLFSTSIRSTPIEGVETTDQHYKLKNGLLTNFIPRWVTKTIEFIELDVGDINTGR